ncbi:MAG: hypothetical protein ACOCRO_03950 [Halanaerobiales bacterium]
MNYNSLIEIGSKADAIIRFKTDIDINGQHFEANEPYLLLKDVRVLIDYGKIEKQTKNTKFESAYTDINPRVVGIGAISFSRKLASLLATYESETTYNPTKSATLAANDGYIYMTDDVDDTKDIFIYNSDFDKIEDFTYDDSNNSIYSDDFVDGNEYLILFSSVRSGSRYNLLKPHIPYMSLEIQGVGNVDKSPKDVYMYFDKVSLNSIISFNFIQDDRMNVPLEFKIIDDKNNILAFED